LWSGSPPCKNAGGKKMHENKARKKVEKSRDKNRRKKKN
jgi:hypothetical protein